MTVQKLTIGALSAQTGSNVPTIRYYEQIGLLPKPERAINGHRYYRDSDLKRLTFIKRCRDFGFPIEQVRELVGLFEESDRSCSEVRDMAQEHLNAVRVKLEELRQLEASLSAFVDSCNETCIEGAASNCVIIKDLSGAEQKATQDSLSSCCGGPLKTTPARKMHATELKRG